MAKGKSVVLEPLDDDYTMNFWYPVGKQVRAVLGDVVDEAYLLVETRHNLSDEERQSILDYASTRWSVILQSTFPKDGSINLGSQQLQILFTSGRQITIGAEKDCSIWPGSKQP